MVMALKGVRVLDLSRLAPGPYCTMILGDLGAEVIRVEAMDPRARVEGWLGLSPEAIEKFRAYNPSGRNKKSIVIDLKREKGRQIFYRLARDADVILEEFRPGVVKELGVDYETIRKLNPKIVYCALTGYGQTGPYAKMPGHDINYIALAGALSVIRDKEDRPIVPSNFLADLAGGGMHAALAILAALVARTLHGVGQYVDCAMTDGVVNLMHFAHLWYVLCEKTDLLPTDKTGFIGLPFCNVYKTKDGKWVSIANVEPWFWNNFCKALKREDLIPWQLDPKRYDELEAFLKGIFQEKTRDEWFDFFRDKNVCFAPVYSIDEAEEDSHLRIREMFVEVDHPKFGKIRQVGVSVKLSETPGKIRSTGPLPGKHTDTILRELGYDEGEIEKLRVSRVVA